MLAAAQRLRRRQEFAATIRSGRRAGRGGVVVHLSPAPAGASTAQPRAGFVVARSVGGAVVRNKVRRRLRHLTRERLVQFEPGTDLVIRALPDAAGRRYAQLGADLDAALAAARTPARASSRRDRRADR